MLPTVISSLLLLCVLAVGSSAHEEQITMCLTYENAVSNDDRVFSETTEWFRTTRKSTYEIMRDRERVNPNFRFQTREHRVYGHFVTHVHGVEGDWNEKTYWAFLKRTSAGDCFLSLGVSSYIPTDGDHLVLSLQKYPNNLPSCASLDRTTTTTQAPSDSSTVTHGRHKRGFRHVFRRPHLPHLPHIPHFPPIPRPTIPIPRLPPHFPITFPPYLPRPPGPVRLF
ncbi:hypothetical protein NP493_413g02011 [Ridgeia piscesae]|uniref:Uncharacterized protein n=1 Tax=Ridgeia piscesae TaxID=27915 RepID=A0AAD9L1Z1_RIDPI|nr:hypothetical protein NP493_413g02011 [Ridgeia piscesae]